MQVSANAGSYTRGVSPLALMARPGTDPLGIPADVGSGMQDDEEGEDEFEALKAAIGKVSPPPWEVVVVPPAGTAPCHPELGGGGLMVSGLGTGRLHGSSEIAYAWRRFITPACNPCLLLRV